MVKIERSKEWWMKKAAAEETDEQFVERMTSPGIKTKEEMARLFALARRGAAMQWRPISEAPKDGTEIVVFNGCTHLAQFANGKWEPTEVADGLIAYVTHFLPLPPPPAGETNER